MPTSELLGDLLGHHLVQQLLRLALLNFQGFGRFLQRHRRLVQLPPVLKEVSGCGTGLSPQLDTATFSSSTHMLKRIFYSRCGYPPVKHKNKFVPVECHWTIVNEIGHGRPGNGPGD